MTHNKGPWTALAPVGDDGPSQSVEVVFHRNWQDLSICEVNTRSMSSTEEAVADANLIAAAPEMLAVLLDALDSEQIPTSWKIHFAKATDKATATTEGKEEFKA